jgi:acetaldehyde dehydrogenase
MNKIRVAIIGTGNIGADLCERMLLDSRFDVVALIGRRQDSPGLLRFKGRINNLMSEGIEDLKIIINEVDGVFDATSAHSHLEHWEVAVKAKKWMIDLTPSKIGTPVVPQLIDYIPSMFMNGEKSQNFSMITCGGQSGAPLAYALSRSVGQIFSLEISSSIAALSAGPATRDNIDQYIESTENLMTIVSGVQKVKAILVLNPAEPPVMMRTTVSLAADSIDLEAAQSGLREIVVQTKRYVPGYEVTVEPHSPKPGMISATVKVSGAGYFLPSYAGNLDIINAAAVQTAKIHMNEINAVSIRRI